MTSESTSSELATSRYRALQRLARRETRSTEEYLVLYALEGFPARLSDSDERANFVLKGGMLLAAFDTRRPTRDVDVQAQQLANDVGAIQAAVRHIAGIRQPDGLHFDLSTLTAEVIRDDEDYSGVRVSLDARLATGRMKLKVDVSVGDPIWPQPQQIQVPRLLEEEDITLRGYPLHMVHAEKIVTAVARGLANTRWRDFADMYLLSESNDVDGDLLQEAIRAVARHREVALMPLAKALDGYPALAQDRWLRWRAKHRPDDRLPEQFTEVLSTVQRFADPALSEVVDGKTWGAHLGRWTEPA